RDEAQREKRLLEMAVLLDELRTLSAQADALKAALEREQAQARPVLGALQTLGAAYKFQVEQAAAVVKANRAAVEQQRAALRNQVKKLNDERTALVSEQSTKQQELHNLVQHFALRETHRDRLRNEGWLCNSCCFVDCSETRAVRSSLSFLT